MKRHPTIMVTGLSGVGKTHLLNSSSEVAKFEVVQFGKEMRTILKENGSDDKRDLSSLPLDDRHLVQGRVVRLIQTKTDKGPVVVDGHLLVEQVGTQLMVPGMPGDSKSQLELNAIVLVLDSPEKIVERRKNDQKRRYEQYSKDKDFVNEMQECLKYVCLSYAAAKGAFFASVDLRHFDDLEKDANWIKPKVHLEELLEQIISHLE